MKRILLLALTILLPQIVIAGPMRLLVESNTDEGAGSEVFAASFATFDDFINSPPGGNGGSFSGININPSFDIVGFANEFEIASVPEPASLGLLVIGWLGLVVVRRKKLV